MASTSTPQMEPPNAFDEIAPEPSTSDRPSKRLKKLCYDVFINHRGPDVKHTLAMNLYTTLKEMGLTVFLDTKELELGDFLPREITETMRTASLHIAIFSKRYAESAWCLAELSFMLQTGTPIVPVFYHVEPTDLRWVGKGQSVYNPAFSQHEQKGRYTPEKLQEWRTALYQVSYYHGHIINNNNEFNDEVSLLKNIVDVVCKVVKDVPLVVAKHPVGLDEVVKDFEINTLQSAQSSHPNVQIVGIWGMGGSGKTTLAMQIYNNRRASMERISFLFDVRDAASKSLLHEKQKKLLKDLGVEGVSFDSVEEGKGILASRLRSVRVLVILDDVDHMDQLDALLPVKDSLGSGSLVIVTTREFEVLRCWGISSIYKMKEFDRTHAEQLFCWHAFLRPSPLYEFEELVKRFLDACNGLPLSLKVFGGQLYGNSCQVYWNSHLHKLSRIMHTDVKQRLRISYDALDDEEKEMFLDTACFFIGEERNFAIDVWDGLGWSGLHSWERLVNKCLVELREDNRIRMHDHLRDLGREIASKHSPHRLWSPEQVINAQNQLAEKIMDIRGIRATTTIAESGSELQQGLCGLADSSPRLKFFVKSQYSNQIIENIVSRELVWLKYEGHTRISSPLSLRNLRVLELQSLQENSDLEELWQTEGDAPVELRQLTISNCPKVQTSIIKSIGRLKHLKKIVLKSSLNVTSLPEEFCLLQSLEHLQLEGYSCKISSLPSRFGDLRNLRHLQLEWWEELRMLPVSFKQLTLLNHLVFYRCSKLTIKSDIFENMRMLQYIDFRCCGELQELPRHITNQVSLRALYLGGTSIREVPNNIGELSKLREMEIVSKLLTSLPISLGNLSSLTNLEITDCPKLEALPESMGNLSSLTILHISYCPNLECLPDSLGRLNQLTELSIKNAGVKNLAKSVRELINLRTLSIWRCSINELNFGPESFQLCDLKSIYLFFTQVSKISISEDCCPGLETVTLWENHRLMEIESLPRRVKWITLESCTMVKNIRGIGGLVNLQELWINNCLELDELPSFAELVSLKKFKLRSCYKVEKIEGLQHCRSLKTLTLYEDHSLMEIESLPRTVKWIKLKDCKMVKNIRGIGGLVNLQDLRISNCLELDELPSFAELVSLKEFKLRSCYKVEKIEGLQHCRSLETLTLYEDHRLMEIESLPRTIKEIILESCKMVKNIRGIGGLVNLQKLRISSCSELDELPSFAESASLKEFELKSCYKVKKIQGVQHCRSLEVLIAHNRWEVAGIESLEQMEGLRRLQLTTCKRSAIEPCIQTLQKWPEEIAICTRAVPNAGSLVNSFAFPNLFVVDSFANQKVKSFGDNYPRLVQKRSSNAGEAIMVCFVINCVSSSHTAFEIDGDDLLHYKMELEEGKWVWIGVFTQPSTWVTSKTYGIFKDWRHEENDCEDSWRCEEDECEAEKGVVAMGEEKSIVEAFHMLFTLLGS